LCGNCCMLSLEKGALFMKRNAVFNRRFWVTMTILVSLLLGLVWYVGPKFRHELWTVFNEFILTKDNLIMFVVIFGFVTLVTLGCLVINGLLIKIGWVKPDQYCPTCGHIISEGHSLYQNQPKSDDLCSHVSEPRSP
ncbi:MAG: hypothetical protein NTY66_04570, partial [Candidatus Vogelbacteria bacterium]|nr:hypothetical protein [Candidatus Vogelbacteria bacterium]